LKKANKISFEQTTNKIVCDVLAKTWGVNKSPQYGDMCWRKGGGARFMGCM